MFFQINYNVSRIRYERMFGIQDQAQMIKKDKYCMHFQFSRISVSSYRIEYSLNNISLFYYLSYLLFIIKIGNRTNISKYFVHKQIIIK